MFTTEQNPPYIATHMDFRQLRQCVENCTELDLLKSTKYSSHFIILMGNAPWSNQGTCFWKYSTCNKCKTATTNIVKQYQQNVSLLPRLQVRNYSPGGSNTAEMYIYVTRQRIHKSIQCLCDCKPTVTQNNDDSNTAIVRRTAAQQQVF